MASIIEKVIQIKVDTVNAVKEIKQLYNTLLEENKKSVQAQDELNQSIKDIKKSTENAEKGIKGLGSAFSFVGMSIRAMGIGLLLEALGLLKDLFLQNATVSNAFSVAMKAISLVFNDFINLILNSTDGIKKTFQAIFEDPVGSLKKFGQLLYENIQVRIESAIAMIGNLGDAIIKVFKGDWQGALDSAKKAGNSFIDMQTGVKDTLDKVSKAVGEYTEKVWEEAEAYVKLEQTVALAMARNKGLIEQYDRLAEVQRQVRDEESNSIPKRIEANEKLGAILDAQQKIMISNADLAIKKAKIDVAENATIENKVALIEAQNEKTAILAQIEGYRSEQLVNRMQLEKELNELNQLSIDGTNERIITEQRFKDSVIVNNVDRLNAERATIEAELELERKRLKDKRDLYNEGTLDYEEANQELLNINQKYSEELRSNDISLNNALVENRMQSLQNILTNEMSSFDERRNALDEQRTVILEGDFASEELRTAALQANSEARKQIDFAEFQAKQALQSQLAALADASVELLGEQTALGKAMAIASTTIDTYRGAQAAFVGMTAGNPTPVGYAMGIAAMAASIVSGLANVKKILSVKVPKGGGGGGSAPGGGSPATSPVFNVVGASSENQLATSMTESQNSPTRAYVLSGEVTTAQSLDRNRIENSTIIG